MKWRQRRAQLPYHRDTSYNLPNDAGVSGHAASRRRRRESWISGAQSLACPRLQRQACVSPAWVSGRKRSPREAPTKYGSAGIYQRSIELDFDPELELEPEEEE
jgi:hypothetical protein